MNELIISGLWKMAEEACLERDLESIKKICNLLEQENDVPEVTAVPVKAVYPMPGLTSAKLVMTAPQPRQQSNPQSSQYNLYSYHPRTRDLIKYLETTIFPAFAKEVKSTSFLLGGLIAYIKENFKNDDVVNTTLGQLLRTYFVERGVTEIRNSKQVAFTQSYLERLEGVSSPTQESSLMLNDLVHYEKNLLPLLLKHFSYAPTYTLQELEEEFLERKWIPHLSNNATLANFIYDLVLYMENKGHLEFENGEVTFTSNYITKITSPE